MALVHAAKKSGVVDDVFPIAIVDFNFSLLTKENGACINECSVFDYNRGTGQTFHILPNNASLQEMSLPSNKQTTFTRHFFHKIPLDFGSCELLSFGKSLNTLLEKNYNAILVKGNAKEDVLGDLLSPDAMRYVFNLDKLACPTLDVLRNTYTSAQQSFCVFHAPRFHGCTALKCCVIERWLTDNYQATKYFIDRYLEEHNL
jgi:hypothetical protein